MTNNNINTALDSVLSAGGVNGLKPADLKRMREAMRKALSDSHIVGSNDCERIIREHYILVPRQAGGLNE